MAFALYGTIFAIKLYLHHLLSLALHYLSISLCPCVPRLMAARYLVLLRHKRLLLCIAGVVTFTTLFWLHNKLSFSMTNQKFPTADRFNRKIKVSERQCNSKQDLLFDEFFQSEQVKSTYLGMSGHMIFLPSAFRNEILSRIHSVSNKWTCETLRFSSQSVELVLPLGVRFPT